jgi:MFS family permease
LALGLIAAAQFMPVLVFGLFGGIVADAVNKRNALFVTQIAAGLLALILGILVASDRVEVWMVFVLALGLGTVNAFDMPIRQSFVVEMVGREDIANAVALNSAVFNVTRIIGPAIAGLTIAAIGIEPLFFINAASYLAVVVSLIFMRTHDLHPPRERAIVERNWRSVVDALAEGLRYTRRDQTIFLAITVLGVVSTFALNFSVLIRSLPATCWVAMPRRTVSSWQRRESARWCPRCQSRSGKGRRCCASSPVRRPSASPWSVWAYRARCR